ncbi:hypothetical protein C5S42_11190, partial [Candidatus Methanomarinus sp.]
VQKLHDIHLSQYIYVFWLGSGDFVF